MALDRKSATARRDLQRPSPTFVQKREIFERLSHKSKALNVIIFLSRPIGAVFGLSTLFYYHRIWPVIIILLQWFGLSNKSPWLLSVILQNFIFPHPFPSNLKKLISRISPYPGAENLIHPLYSPTYSPGWPGVLPLGEADDMCISKKQQNMPVIILPVKLVNL